MNIEKDIVDKYTTEQIIAHLDSLMTGILKNYQTSVKTNQPHIIWGNLGDIAQAKAILHEMKKRNDAVEAQKQSMV